MKNLIVALYLIISAGINAQKGFQFPPMNGNTLDGKPASIPFKNNKQTIVAIAYHKGAEDDLKKWLNPLYTTFIKKEKGAGGNMDMAELYDVNFVFVPLISGFKKVANEFKSGTEKEFWPYIMDTEKSDINNIQNQLKVNNNKVPYFYVLDKDGKIIETVTGAYTDEKLEKLEDAVE
ncbi:MAG: hypothetical protein HYX39_00795 [Bacteroidetes bacterium]|nr:hypothetical protein [Bacteroidota bacterium]